ncbi:MAG: nicotinamide-nucleotide adenylyltransferase [Theionarchaea archaeon]|nr:nicotinamide-nucleotide adenylyltransferase [Theionarchaea archaeon]
MRALYVGRFQPFHLGHLEILKKILAEYHEVIIIVGSAQHSHTLENPFTAGERIQMITETLDEEGITKRVYIIPIDDIHRHSVWVRQVESLTPEFEIVFSNEPVSIRLFKEAGYAVKRTSLIHRGKWSGTEIRRRILADGAWEECIPSAVARVIKEIDGIARIRELARNDKG